jgi:hypothetical protein
VIERSRTSLNLRVYGMYPPRSGVDGEERNLSDVSWDEY